jgi:hypothetical protein
MIAPGVGERGAWQWFVRRAGTLLEEVAPS